MTWSRRFFALYGLIFFLAVAAAPHHHLNSIEDLLSDGPSDSGVFIEASGPGHPISGLGVHACRLVDDEPCLACFNHDFVAATAATRAVLPRPTPLRQVQKAMHFFRRKASPQLSDSRAPPRAV
jgi:hypothetical protein